MSSPGLIQSIKHMWRHSESVHRIDIKCWHGKKMDLDQLTSLRWNKAMELNTVNKGDLFEIHVIALSGLKLFIDPPKVMGLQFLIEWCVADHKPPLNSGQTDLQDDVTWHWVKLSIGEVSSLIKSQHTHIIINSSLTILHTHTQIQCRRNG